MAADLLGVLTPRLHLITEQHNTVAAFVIMLNGWAEYSREETWHIFVCVCVSVCVRAAYCETKLQQLFSTLSQVPISSLVAIVDKNRHFGLTFGPFAS